MSRLSMLKSVGVSAAGRGLTSAARTTSLRLTAVAHPRFMSTERKDPKIVAESLLNAFPGSNLTSKSSSVLVAASIATYLISKEIYIIDAEFFEMVCIFGAYYIWYSNAKDSVASYLNGKRESMLKILTEARSQHKQVVQERIEHFEKLSDSVDVTKALYQLSKDSLKLEAEAYELKQKVKFTTDVKATLDAWVRHEANVRDQEQKLLAEHVMEKVKAQLNNPSFQKSVLANALNEFHELSLKGGKKTA